MMDKMACPYDVFDIKYMYMHQLSKTQNEVSV